MSMNFDMVQTNNISLEKPAYMQSNQMSSGPAAAAAAPPSNQLMQSIPLMQSPNTPMQA